MKLYGSTASPFVQRVLMVARIKGHEIEPAAIPGGAPWSAEFRAISPMGRIPLLELDDGTRICESDAIVGYLDDTLPGPAVLPDDPAERAHARAIMSLTLCEVAAGIRPIMVHNVFRMGEAPEVVEAARAQLAKGLDAIEQVRRAGDRLAAGDEPGAADAILAPLLALMRAIDAPAGTAALIDERPGLAAYYQRASEDPVVGRSIAEVIDGFAKIMARNAQAAKA